MPMFTVLLRKASGAGYYAMAGLPYEPVVQLSTSLARLSVMEGRTLAIAAFNTKLDDDFEIIDDRSRRAREDRGGHARDRGADRAATWIRSSRRAQMDTDEIVELGELRAWLAALVEMTLPEHRLSPGQEPADLVDARSRACSSEARDERSLRRAHASCSRARTAHGWFHRAGRRPIVPLDRAGRPVGAARGSAMLDMLARRRSASPRQRSRARPATRDARAVRLSATCCSASRPGAIAGAAERGDAGHAAATGLVFRAPTSGRYYGRSSPDKPAFVTAGDELPAGATVCLLEVMKTFNRVTYSGGGARACAPRGARRRRRRRQRRRSAARARSAEVTATSRRDLPSATPPLSRCNPNPSWGSRDSGLCFAHMRCTRSLVLPGVVLVFALGSTARADKEDSSPRCPGEQGYFYTNHRKTLTAKAAPYSVTAAR